MCCSYHTCTVSSSAQLVVALDGMVHAVVPLLALLYATTVLVQCPVHALVHSGVPSRGFGGQDSVG